MNESLESAEMRTRGLAFMIAATSAMKVTRSSCEFCGFELE